MDEQQRASSAELLGTPPAAPGEAKKRNKEKKEKSAGDTLLRVTYRNHIALSQLADTKANMLISINGVIVSVLIALLTPRLGTFGWEFAPAIVLMAACVTSLAFAVIASRPRLNRRPITLEQVRRNEGNVLFFGQFMSLSLADFQESMRIMTKDPALVRDNLSRQLYHMGEALLAKYARLQIAYVVFLSGMAVAAVLFIVIFVGMMTAGAPLQ